jgi:hypothetical protein
MPKNNFTHYRTYYILVLHVPYLNGWQVKAKNIMKRVNGHDTRLMKWLTIYWEKGKNK